MRTVDQNGPARVQQEKRVDAGRIWVIPWFAAAVVSALIPFALSGLWFGFPEVRPFLSRGEPEVYLFGFGGIEGLRGTSKTYLELASWCFVGVGMALLARRWPKWSDARTMTATAMGTLGLIFLCAIAPRLATVWALAIQGGYGPSDLFQEVEGNHGPWRHAYNLRLILLPTLLLPLAAMGLCVLSALLRSSLRAWILSAAALATFWLLMVTHYGLID